MAKKVVKKTTTIESVPNVETSSPTYPKMNSKYLTLALIILGLALITYKVGPYFVPAMVDGKPITRIALWQRLEKSYGPESLQQLIDEKTIDFAIAKSRIKVEKIKVDEQISNFEKQFESLGGLDVALEQRGLSRKELEKQIQTQIAIEEILQDKVKPTDEEVRKQYEDGLKTTYKDKKFEEVQSQITEEIKQNKLRDAFLSWFEQVKKEIEIKKLDLVK